MGDTSIPDEHATLLNKAREAYLGECVDKWEGMESEVVNSLII